MHINNFITFEGIEGSGKSTQVKLLAESFLKNGLNFIHTREPGGTAEAEAIRHIIVSGNPDKLDKITELLLIIAARNEHIKKKVKPALEDNKFVICDRFIDSTIAYQGYGHNIDIDLINNLHQIILENIRPSLTFILNMDIEAALTRITSRNTIEDRFEKMKMEFHLRMQEGFIKIYEKNKDRCVILEANRDINSLHKDIIDIVNKKFNQKLKYIN